MKRITLAIASFVFSFTVLASDNGCWSGNHSEGSCLHWEAYTKNGNSYFKLTNLCKDRLYVKWCVADKCGTDGLKAGETKTKYEYTASLDRQVWAVGSKKWNQDFVCADGWN